jgi:hypothetical protein
MTANMGRKWYQLIDNFKLYGWSFSFFYFIGTPQRFHNNWLSLDWSSTALLVFYDHQCPREAAVWSHGVPVQIAYGPVPVQYRNCTLLMTTVDMR